MRIKKEGKKRKDRNGGKIKRRKQKMGSVKG